ncbi:MAG: hypothetical protein JNJ44_08075 [Zoogloeaceae bacterium]|nr:hypothetical protein [Zoogloeaceae bacterium]
MPRTFHRGALLLALALGPWSAAAAWEMAGTKTVFVHTRDGQKQRIGTVSFTPAAGDRVAFKVALETERFTDYFLSMREFKCLNGGEEVVCHIPYPHRQPGSIAAQDLTWLEHNLLFFFKQPSDFGAKLWNGIYFQLEAGPAGLVGKPRAIDLNMIGAPPADDLPPYSPALRDDMPLTQRWIQSLSIE